MLCIKVWLSRNKFRRFFFVITVLLRLCYLYSLDFEYKIILYSFVMRTTALVHRHHSQSQLLFCIFATHTKASPKWLTIEPIFCSNGQTSGGLDLVDSRRECCRWRNSFIRILLPRSMRTWRWIEWVFGGSAAVGRRRSEYLSTHKIDI